VVLLKSLIFNQCQILNESIYDATFRFNGCSFSSHQILSSSILPHLFECGKFINFPSFVVLNLHRCDPVEPCFSSFFSWNFKFSTNIVLSFDFSLFTQQYQSKTKLIMSSVVTSFENIQCVVFRICVLNDCICNFNAFNDRQFK
jgi:hypothetical protein